MTDSILRELKNYRDDIDNEFQHWYDFAIRICKEVRIEDQPESNIETLGFADLDFFPNIRKLLLIGAVSPIGSTEPERAASGIRRLKTVFRSTMTDRLESNLNLLQMQQTTTVNVDRVAEVLIKQHPRRLSNPTMFSE